MRIKQEIFKIRESIILSSSPRCTNVFKAKPFVAFRRSNNLSNILVSAKLHKPVTVNNEPRGSFRCGNNCLTSNYKNDGLTMYTFNSTGETRLINHHIDCNSKNVIYMIQCHHCQKQYIGKTKRGLKGTVSQTAHVQVINQKWSDVFKFVVCETKWRQQAEDNPHSHGDRRNLNSGRKQFFLIPAAAGKRNGRSREEEFGSK